MCHKSRTGVIQVTWVGLLVTIGAVVEYSAGLFIVVRIERSVGGCAGVCCGRSGVPGSGSGAGRSHCVKPFTGGPAVHS